MVEHHSPDHEPIHDFHQEIRGAQTTYDSSDDSSVEVNELVLDVLSAVDNIVTDITIIDQDIENLVQEFGSVNLENLDTTQVNDQYLNSFNIPVDDEKTAASLNELLGTYWIVFEKLKSAELHMHEKEEVINHLNLQIKEQQNKMNNCQRDLDLAQETIRSAEESFDDVENRLNTLYSRIMSF